MAMDADGVRLKRAYEPASPEDGTRVLVERLWPRGVSKAKAALDDWAKDVVRARGRALARVPAAVSRGARRA